MYIYCTKGTSSHGWSALHDTYSPTLLLKWRCKQFEKEKCFWQNHTPSECVNSLCMWSFVTVTTVKQMCFQGTVVSNQWCPRFWTLYNTNFVWRYHVNPIPHSKPFPPQCSKPLGHMGQTRQQVMFFLLTSAFSPYMILSILGLKMDSIQQICQRHQYKTFVRSVALVEIGNKKNIFLQCLMPVHG